MNNIYQLPKNGEVKYTENGLCICHICGKAFKKLGGHIWNNHGVTTMQYKKEFGLDNNTKLTSLEYQNQMRYYTSLYYDKVVVKNLKKGGENTRFTKGDKGRTIDKVSMQTMKRLKQNFVKRKDVI